MILSRTTRVRGAAFAIVAFVSGAACAYPLEAQQSQATSSLAAGFASYRAPAIALPDDPLDVATLFVSIAGEDRTKARQKTAAQAWSSIGEAPAVRPH